MAIFSDWLRGHPHSQSPHARERISIAMSRLPNVLERELVAHQKTLEQKISDQGPKHLRVDPHLLGLAIRELSVERGIICAHTHPETGARPWYANARHPPEVVQPKLDTLAPLYAQVSIGNFSNLIGDALELVVFKALQSLNEAKPHLAFDGAFDLSSPKNSQGRYKKIEPSNTISGHSTTKRADFILYGFPRGPICIECKNYREWIYPDHHIITELIKKSIELQTTPLLIARRIHYTTLTNFLEPAGIIAHQSYYQYYPADKQELVKKLRHKRSLGFSDIRATEEPDTRTLKFFHENLQKISDSMAERFRRNQSALEDYINEDINLAQVYNAIGSPAAGNWVDFDSTS